MNFTINNYYTGQAEALLISGSKNIVSHMTLKGSGDALNLRAARHAFRRQHHHWRWRYHSRRRPRVLHSLRASSRWGRSCGFRNTDANHGNVFVDSTFIALERPLPWNKTAPTPPSRVLARLPNNHGLNYPYAEAVLIPLQIGRAFRPRAEIRSTMIRRLHTLHGIPQHGYGWSSHRCVAAASSVEAIDAARRCQDDRRL